jgi:hypothetical protein
MGSSYGDNISVTQVPAEEPESAEEFTLMEAEVTQWDEWNDPEHLPLGGTIVRSIGLPTEEQREEQAEIIRRFQPSPVSEILKRAMEQPQQSEIVMVQSESEAPSPRVSSEDSDSDARDPCPDDENTPTWTVPSFPFHDHIVQQPESYPDLETTVRNCLNDTAGVWARISSLTVRGMHTRTRSGQ